jgi:hypothetical protein
MADLAVAFASSPVEGGEQTAFVEGVLPDTKTTIELDLGGNVRLTAIAFEAGFIGASMTISAVVPWEAGDDNALIDGLSVTIVAGKVVPLPYSDYFWPPKILLTVNTAQTSDKKIGFFGWRGEIE